MRPSFVLCTTAALLFSASVVARAASMDFTLSGGATGSGTLFGVADPFTAGAFDITSVTGTINGVNIELEPGSTFNSSGSIADPSGLYNSNDVIYLRHGSQKVQGGDVGAFLDGAGIVFLDDNGVLDNIFTFGGYQFTDSPGIYPNFVPVAFTLDNFIGVPEVPEPSSLALLGTGLLGAIGAVRRRIAK